MCSACAPTIVAVASSQCSAIHLRRVIPAFPRPHRSVNLHAKTLRGTLFASPSVLPFLGWVSATSFSRLSLRLSSPASSRLPSWLLSWLPFAYSPFSMGCIDVCNEYIAVEECIELWSIDVKKKTTYEWKNRQQLFSDRRAPSSPIRTSRRFFSSAISV